MPDSQVSFDHITIWTSTEEVTIKNHTSYLTARLKTGTERIKLRVAAKMSPNNEIDPLVFFKNFILKVLVLLPQK